MPDRRSVLFTIALAPLAACARLRPEQGPRLWRAEGPGRVYLFGFAEAPDRSWLTPAIEAAFAESKALWLETPPLGPPAPGSETAALIAELGVRPGRSFYDGLEPDVRERARAYVAELQIPPQTIEPVRPWLGYIVINGAFWAARGGPGGAESPELALRSMAAEAGTPIFHELATEADALRFFAGMTEAEESQYVEMLLDYLDDEKAGLNADAYGWTRGEPRSQALDRMRERTPDLYRKIQVERNMWWAAKIEELLAAGGTSFIAVGMNHMLGPDGIPAQLERRGIDLQRAA